MSSESWIPNCIPHFWGTEEEYVLETIRAEWIGSGGPVYERFVAAFCEYTQAPHALPVITGSAALHLALRVLEIGPGDSVYVPSLTFAASATPAAQLGARVVPVDVEPGTWTLCAHDLKRAIDADLQAGETPRAVVPVHLYSMPADLDAIEAVCRPLDMAIVEDTAEGLGTFVDGTHLGLRGDIGCFSFNVNKLVTSGGGGFLVSEDQSLVERARHLANQARTSAVQFHHDAVGYNYRFSALNAGVGLAQLENIEAAIRRKREIFACYVEELGGLLELQEAPVGVDCGYWLSNAMLPEGCELDAERVVAACREARVEVRPYFMPLHLQPSWPDRPCPVAERAWRRGLSLPSSVGISAAELDRVVATLRGILGGT